MSDYDFQKNIVFFCLNIFFTFYKECRPWWNAALCCISSGSSPYAKNCLFRGFPGYKGLSHSMREPVFCLCWQSSCYSWSLEILAISNLAITCTPFTHLNWMNYPSLINWTSPVPISGLLGGILHFDSNLDRAFVNKQCRTRLDAAKCILQQLILFCTVCQCPPKNEDRSIWIKATNNIDADQPNGYTFWFVQVFLRYG